MNEEFSNIVNNLQTSHYFDDEAWYRDILNSSYEIIAKDGFGIMIEYYFKFGKKIGFSRGGIRFEKGKKTFAEYLDFINYLKSDLKIRNYMFLSIDHVEEEDEFNKVFEKNNFRDYIHGTAVIRPKTSWISKFNSKKRYDLLYAGKKGVLINIYSNSDLVINKSYSSEFPHNLLGTDSLRIDKFYSLVEDTKKRVGENYFILDKEAIKRLFDKKEFILVVAEFENQLVSFNLSLVSPKKNRIERVFAGSSTDGLKLRAPSLIEMTLVDILSQVSIETYDLWGIREGDGFTNFKKSLADEIISYTSLSVIKIDRVLANITINLIKCSTLIKKFI